MCELPDVDPTSDPVSPVTVDPRLYPSTPEPRAVCPSVERHLTPRGPGDRHGGVVGV